MHKRLRYALTSLACGLTLASSACDQKAPTAPTPQPTTPASPIVSLAIVAPSEVAPGATFQLTANESRADGSVKNVSATATWTVQNASSSSEAPAAILQVSASGLATARNRGEVIVRASVGSLQALTRVMVLPPGTFRISGSVNEGGVGLEGSTVTVTSGVGEGLTTRTSQYGSFALFGVSGAVTIQAQTAGYLDAVQQLNVSSHRNVGFAVVPTQPRSDFSGTYTLTITAQAVCPSAFPVAAKRRVYTASVRQEIQGQLWVTLSGVDFSVHSGYGRSFFGQVTSYGDVRFWMSQDYYYSDEYDIAEHFGETALLIDASLSTRGTPDLISGYLEGKIIVAGSATYPFTPFAASCPTDRFEMVRQ